MIPTLEDIIRGLLDGTLTHEQAGLYFAEHERLEREIGALPTLTLEFQQTVADGITKYSEQLKRWGDRDYPPFDLTLMSDADTNTRVLAGYYAIPNAAAAVLRRGHRATIGELAWFDVLLGEVCKLTLHHENLPALRGQLIDVIGVATAWATKLTDFQISARTMAPPEDLDAPPQPDHEGPRRGESHEEVTYLAP